jgi:hypothetical protein
MNIVNEDIFRTFQRELIFSEKDMTFERLASAIREFDRKYDFRNLSSHSGRILIFNATLFAIVLVILLFRIKAHKIPLSAQEVRSIEWQVNIIPTLALLSVFPIFLFLDTLFLYLSSFKSTEDILQQIKRKKDYYLNIESIHQWNTSGNDLFKDEKLLRFFMLTSMKNHFDFLLKYEEKMKDKTNALIPIASTCVVVFSYYVIGIPKSVFTWLNQTSDYATVAILTGILAVIYIAVNQSTHERLTVKYLKCIAILERLKFFHENK